MTIKDRLNHAVTAYDRCRQGKRGYNFYALGLYLKRVDECCAEITDASTHAEIEDILRQGFNGRLLDCVLEACEGGLK